MKKEQLKNNIVKILYFETSKLSFSLVYPTRIYGCTETSSKLTHFSTFPTDVSIYKENEAMFIAQGSTGSDATRCLYTTYPIDTHLVATSFTRPA